MTTHDDRVETTEADAPPVQAEPSNAVAEPPTERTAPAPAHSGQPRNEPAAVPGATEESTGATLFAGNDLSGMRSRWDDVQAAFVDDPKDCVQNADALVAEVVERLTTSFAETRSQLEARWARGEDASTEDLRLALQRYREFFQRLLSV